MTFKEYLNMEISGDYFAIVTFYLKNPTNDPYSDIYTRFKEAFPDCFASFGDGLPDTTIKIKISASSEKNAQERVFAKAKNIFDANKQNFESAKIIVSASKIEPGLFSVP